MSWGVEAMKVERKDKQTRSGGRSGYNTASSADHSKPSLPHPFRHTLIISTHHHLSIRIMSNHPSSSYNTSMTPDEQHLADVRQATNFRSVTRNDPSVQEIMDTSVYSVIYHYEAAAGEWVKQKQEGPLFVVRRWVWRPSQHGQRWR